MKRLVTVATAMLMLAATGAQAQAAAEPSRHRTESPWSPLTYERLGATPKVDLGRLFGRPATRAEASKPAAGQQGDAARAVAQQTPPRTSPANAAAAPTAN